jgi:hypothetical protein
MIKRYNLEPLECCDLEETESPQGLYVRATDYEKVSEALAACYTQVKRNCLGCNVKINRHDAGLMPYKEACWGCANWMALEKAQEAYGGVIPNA